MQIGRRTNVKIKVSEIDKPGARDHFLLYCWSIDFSKLELQERGVLSWDYEQWTRDMMCLSVLVWREKTFYDNESIATFLAQDLVVVTPAFAEFTNHCTRRKASMNAQPTHREDRKT